MCTRMITFACMLCIVTATVASAANKQGGPTSERVASRSHRREAAIQASVHVALCAEADARGSSGHTAAVLELIDIYRELAAHPHRNDSDVLARLGRQLRLRLETISEKIERQITKRDRLAAKRTSPPAFVVPTSHVLAQQIAVIGGAAMGAGAGFASAPPGAAVPADYAADLIAVIQQTISPETWDINGGNGAVVYYAPLHVLVVSAPSSVHDQVGGAIGQLRTAP